LGGALACWIVSLLLSSTTEVGDYGLLSVMHPTFFVAVGLCVTGFLIEVARGARRVWLLLGSLALVLLIMHATVPILGLEPEHAWTHTHVGVIHLFRPTKHIVTPNDIYQAWPTFFATVAPLTTLPGATPLRIAAWPPLFSAAVTCLPVFAFAPSLSRDRRMP